MGLSLTATSAVWVLVDTADGTILADEVVALDSANEIARATARSIQTYALHSDRDIDGVRMTWSADAAAHGVRLRTKMRLFGFDTVETVSEDAARAGRNHTARHIAPHLVLAYGAARADFHDEHRSLFRRLAPRKAIGAAGVAGVAILAGVGLYALLSGTTADNSPATAAAVEPAPAPPAAPAPAPHVAPVAAPLPEVAPAAAPEPAAPVAPAVTASEPETSPATEIAQNVTEQPAAATVVADTLPAPDPAPGPLGVPATAVDSTAIQPAGAIAGAGSMLPEEPHLSVPSAPPAPPATPQAPATSDGPIGFVLGALP